LLGYKHTPEALVKISGGNHPMYGRTGKNNPTKKNVFVYSFNLETKVTLLDRSFNTCAEAALYFDCSTRTLSRYLDKDKVYKDKLYKKQWILSSIMK